MGTIQLAVAHDYLTQRGGAERVALIMARAHPGQPLHTALYNPPTTFPEYSTVGISASWLNRIGPFRRNPQLALPFLHFAWSLKKPLAADIVIASSSGWSHGVRVRADALKVVYCHNPPRWIYQQADYLRGRSTAVRVVLRALAPVLKRWDKQAALTADLYLANSTSVAERIEQAYGIEAHVLHPPVGLSPDGDRTPVSGLADGFYLTVGRKRGYKGTDQLIEAFSNMADESLVVVGGSDLELPNNVQVLSGVSDSQLRWLYANARAFVSVSQEDFGLSPLEANSFGTPCLLVRAGGFIDSTHEGVSGAFFEGISTEKIISSVRGFRHHWDTGAVIEHARGFSAEAFLSRLDDLIGQAFDKKMIDRRRPARWQSSSIARNSRKD